jgi:hypothetical protein
LNSGLLKLGCGTEGKASGALKGADDMNLSFDKSLVLFLVILAIATPCAAAGQSKAHSRLADLADLVVGTYYGDVVSDSKGSSRSDVTVTITKVDRRTYSRLGTVDVRLIKIGGKVLNADGDTVLLLDLEQRPPKLQYNPHNEVAYVGNRQ